MANSLIKGLALTLGGGLALGVGFKMGQGVAPVGDLPESPNLEPILDRLEKMETTVANVEQVLNAPSPMVLTPVLELQNQVKSQRSELESLRAQILQVDRSHASRMEDLSQTVSGLEQRIPGLIDESIKPRFDEMHERVQREMQETASQTLELFADRIQSRVVEKITSIESDLGRQSEAINALRDSSLKTDESMQKLLAGVESLADKISGKFEAPVESGRSAPPPRPAPVIPSQQTPRMAEPYPAPLEIHHEPYAAPQPAILRAPVFPPPPAPSKPANFAPPVSAPPQPSQALKPDFPARIQLGEPDDVRPFREGFNAAPAESRPSSTPYFEELHGRPRSHGLRIAAMAGGGLALTAIVVGGIEFSGALKKPQSAQAASNTKVATAPAVAGSTESLDTGKMAAENDLLDQARGFFDQHEYDKAEDLYRSILKKDPANQEVKRLLARSLFRQDKIDETAKVLNSIGEDKAPE
jgi:TolA-binding protein